MESYTVFKYQVTQDFLLCAYHSSNRETQDDATRYFYIRRMKKLNTLYLDIFLKQQSAFAYFIDHIPLETFYVT